MRILHVTARFSRLGGGVAAYIAEMANRQASAGHDVTVAGLADPYTDADTQGWRARVFAGRGYGPASYGYSASLTRYVRSVLPQVGVCHAHDLWAHPFRMSSRSARRHGKPWVASTHGMLQSWCLANSSAWKKRAFWPALSACLRRASCLHVTSGQELEGVRRLGLTAPAAVIPIGLEAAGYGRCTDRSDLFRRWPDLSDSRIVLFLGRITPVKRIDALIRAWAAGPAKQGNWMLVIAGPDWRGHQAEMARLAESCGVASRVLFTGEVLGPVKSALLGSADLYVLPSECENFAITVAEALASECPVIVTQGTPWQQVETERCGWWIPLDESALTERLTAAMRLTDAERAEMGRRGAELIRREYAWPPLVAKMIAVYEWLTGAGPRPPCVEIA